MGIRRPSVVDWGKVKNDFVNSYGTYKIIAARNDVQESALRVQAMRGGWMAERTAMAKTISDRAAEKFTASRIDELTEFNAIDLKIAKAFRQQIAAHISEAQQKNTKLPPSTIRILTVAAEAAQRIGRLALGASTENKAISGDISISDPLERLTSRLAVLAANEGADEAA